jgi:hypothetical protein
MIKSKYTHINENMLSDLGFIQITSDTAHERDMYDISSAERAYRHPDLEPKNLILVDYDNGGWHFAQRKYAINGIGRMTWLDELIVGFEFVTGTKLLK